MISLKSPGLWLFIGGLEILFLVHLAEILYPGYSVSDNYISDLGVGPNPSMAIFTLAVVLFGLMAIVAAYLMREENKKSLLWPLMMLSGIGAIGVGAFNEDFISPVHPLVSLMAFLFGNLAVLVSSRMVPAPLSYVFVILGLIGLSALALLGGSTYLGLGVGGMERMIFYPAMFWVLSYGAYLMAEEKGTSAG